MHKIKRFFRSILITPLTFLVTLYILLEDFLEHIVKPFVEYISALNILQTTERFLQQRNPYTLLGIYVCKLGTFSGVKFFSLYLISQSNVIGLPLLISGEITSAVLTVWYAKVALPKLLTIEKFAWLYNKLMAIKNWLIDNLKQMSIYQYAKKLAQQIRTKASAIKEKIKQNAKSSSMFKAMYRFLNK